MIFERLKNRLREKFVTGAINRNDRIGALYKAWGHVFTNHIRGDYIEFGVYRGDSFRDSFKQYSKFKDHQYSELESIETWRRDASSSYIDYLPSFHGLDTFSGMPDNNEGNFAFSPGNFPSEIESVRSVCESTFVKDNRYYLYKGLFTETVNQLLENCTSSAAIINIDCDLYESTVDALKSCSPLIQVGTVVLFDDFNCFNADMRQGQRRALAEWEESSNLVLEKYFSYQYVGQAFLCVGLR